jgi:thiamine-phosphate pyrophosphorylase
MRAERIIDANLNRLSEALKVVEDLCRLELADPGLVRRVRGLRNDLNPVVIPLRQRVIGYRDSRADLGRESDFDKTLRADLRDVLVANLKRAQEACRVLEEAGKLEIWGLSPDFKRTRFALYDLEQEIAVRLARRLDLRLYVVLDTATVGRGRLVSVARELAEAGPGVVQLREPKDLPTREFVRDAGTVKRALTGTATKLIINDRVDIALAVGADGVHLGQSDMPLRLARRMLPLTMAIGMSVANPMQARRAEQEGADYLGAGAIFATPSKPEAGAIGIAGLRAVGKATSLPLVAIGGINAANAGQVLRAGADGVAVISAAFGAGSIRANLHLLAKAIADSR